MIRNAIRKWLGKYGYDITKTDQYVQGKKYKQPSDFPYLDYYKTPTGNYYFPKNCVADVVANDIKQGKVFDQHIIEIAATYIKKDTIAIDIGANYGQMAIEFSKMVGANGAVYAFEAQEMVFDILQKNVKENNANNVNIFYNAVFDKSGVELTFPAPDLVRFPTYGSYGLNLNTTDGIKVTSIALDSIEFTKPISFMKIDIQGSDLYALRGAVETIKKHQMPIIFEYEEEFQEEFNTSFQQYIEFVDSIGYRFDKTVEKVNYIIVPR